ncbi:MAG: HRDC domain-containing protein [Acutalibacteraceae bacterium]
MNKLKELRRELALKKRVPTYVLFSDAALTDMCVKLPQTPEEFLNVSEVGKVKLKQYSKQFLEVIRKFKPLN